MNPESVSLCLGVGCWVVAVCFSATWLALGGLSGGKLRKIEISNRDLALALEPWYNRRDEYRVILRMLLVVAVLLMGACFGWWQSVSYTSESGFPWLRMGVGLAGAVFFFVSTEVLGRHLSTLSSGRFLIRMLPLVRFCAVLVFPLTVPILVAYRWACGRREARAEESGEVTAEDEIMSLVEQDADEENGDSALEDDERRMIRGIFDLDETFVHEIMTPRVDVDGVEESMSLSEVRQRIVESGHSRIPVYRETVDDIVGVIYAKDLLDAERLQGLKGLSEIYHHPVFIPETKNIGDLLEEFQQNRNHFAIVLDEYGGTAGIVTFEDILEEIVGDIQDEYDDDEEQLQTQVLPDGHLVADARMTIDEVNDALGLDLPEDGDYDTLGGYISASLGRIPQARETIETEHLRAEILAADPRRVLRAKVRKLDPESAGETESEGES